MTIATIENFFPLALLGLALLFSFAGVILYFKRVKKLEFLLAQEQNHLTEALCLKAAADERAKQAYELQATLQESQRHLNDLREKNAALQTQLQAERTAALEKHQLFMEAEKKLVDTFKALSSDALSKNNQSFLDLAKTSFEKFHQGAQTDLTTRQKAISELLSPLKESLTGVNTKLQDLEKVRVGAYEALKQQVADLIHTQKELKNETSHLVHALKTPSVRGRWGEMQLRRVVEMAGMLSYCDFFEQSHVGTEDGRLRPDMVINLPGGKKVIVDAKVPLGAYLEALETTDENLKREKLLKHARQVKSHITALSARSYWQHFESTPEFVVLFLPGESFFSAALENDPSLIEMGVQEKVILATPTTLIALLRATAYGWRQETLEANAKEISKLGQELYKRLSDVGGHISRLGRSLGGAVEAYNQTVGTLERRVLVSARRFKELGAAADKAEIEDVTLLDQLPREVQSEELREGLPSLKELAP